MGDGADAPRQPRGVRLVDELREAIADDPGVLAPVATGIAEWLAGKSDAEVVGSMLRMQSDYAERGRIETVEENARRAREHVDELAQARADEQKRAGETLARRRKPRQRGRLAALLGEAFDAIGDRPAKEARAWIDRERRSVIAKWPRSEQAKLEARDGRTFAAAWSRTKQRRSA